MKKKRMTDGEKQKFEAIYEKYFKYMHRIALARTRDKERALDCFQLSCEKIIRYLDKFQDENSVGTSSYLYLIVNSTAIDQYRKEKRYVVSEEAKIYNYIEFDHCEKERMREFAELGTAEVLDEILSVFTEEENQLLMMRLGQGMTYREIGNELGISETLCRKRMQRLREKVEKRIARIKGQREMNKSDASSCYKK